MLAYVSVACEKPTRKRKYRLPGGVIPQEQLDASQQRTDDAIQWIADGVPMAIIHKRIIAKHKVSYERARRAVHRARKTLAKAARATSIEERLAEAITRTESLIDRCMAAGEASAAVAANRFLGELQGVTAAQQQWEAEREAKHMLTVAQAMALIAKAQQLQREAQSGPGDASRLSDSELISIVETAKVRIDAGNNGHSGNGAYSSDS